MTERQRRAAELLGRAAVAIAALSGMIRYQVDHETKTRAFRDLDRLVRCAALEAGVHLVDPPREVAS